MDPPTSRTVIGKEMGQLPVLIAAYGQRSRRMRSPTASKPIMSQAWNGGCRRRTADCRTIR